MTSFEFGLFNWNHYTEKLKRYHLKLNAFDGT